MIKIITIITLYSVINLFSFAAPATLKRNCNDCVVYNYCDTAVTLLWKRDPVSNAQLKSAFCGFHHNKLPMVCCSELTTGQAPENVENHPNLYLLPGRCVKNKKISGGRAAIRHEFTWMALLAYETPLGPQFKCGGSVISEHYVLTAAHCITQEELIGVRVGELDVDATTACQEQDNCIDTIQDIRIKEAIPHPEYSGPPKVRNDIGLLRLWNPVNLYFKNTGAICLPVTGQQQSRDLSKELATIAGWGYTEQGASSVLRAVTVPIYPAEKCRQLYNRGRTSDGEDETANKLCAGQKGTGSCDGDSGGPLMVREPGGQFIQYGVDSYGPTLCGADFPSAYTDVRKYVKWILDTLGP